MNQTTAPKKTPSPIRKAKAANNMVGTDKSQSTIFISLALDMSWRLAIVVLVPIIGGFELDKRLNTSPLLSISGLVIALIGMALVLWQMLQAVNKLPAPKKGNRQ